MKIIDKVLVSDEVWSARFACDLGACKGECCHKGDLGAFISAEEAENVKRHLPDLKPYLCKEHFDFLQDGITETFDDGIHIREIAFNHPCPLSYTNSEGIILCALHGYAIQNRIPVTSIKPLWCALFPLLLSKKGDYWVINCFFLSICRSVKNAPPLLLSLGSALTEIFGKEWFSKVIAEYESEGLDTKQFILPSA